MRSTPLSQHDGRALVQAKADALHQEHEQQLKEEKAKYESLFRKYKDMEDKNREAFKDVAKAKKDLVEAKGEIVTMQEANKKNAAGIQMLEEEMKELR